MRKIKIILSAIAIVTALGVSGQNWNTNGDHIYNTNSGKVGIGTSSPVGDLHVVANNANFVLKNQGGTVAGFSLVDGSYGSSGIIYGFRTSAGAFRINNISTGNDMMIIRPDATVSTQLFFNANGLGIGTNNPQSTLHVNGDVSANNLAADGKITTKEVEVTLDGWSDYVFEVDYRLRPLSEVEAFVKTHKHLPGIPSEKEIIENGLSVGEMNKKMMEKIEELTLYVIELQKEIESLKE